MSAPGIARPAVTLNEAQAFVRIETGEEEAVLAGLIRTASALCESFLNRVVVAREFCVDLPASGKWERLSVTPVRSISAVAAVDSARSATPLSAAAYSVDIDFNGDGWVRVSQPGTTRIRVEGTAGRRT